MKAYIVHKMDWNDCDETIQVIGVYSSMDKAINRVYEFEINELDDLFTDEEKEMGFVVDNHNNGYLSAHLDSGYHELIIDVDEAEIDSDDCCINIE